LQLHGSETPARVAEIKRRTGATIMKVIKVETAADAALALDYVGIADLILFDAKAPKDAILPGGNGLTFDWHVLDDVKGRVPYMLSGGLTAGNVAEAIRLTGATRVDVSSGVELAPGEKDADLIRTFIAAAKAV
jgi:phosphoribosylanthranilate isomerase